MNTRQRSGELLADRAYFGVRDRILKLQLAPGSAIDEDALMSELGVGRTPIREAIKRLALEDLVVVFPRRGTFVSEINMTDLGHISELRRALEGYAAYKAAQSSAAQRAQVDALLDEMEARAKAPFDIEALMELDSRVHHFIYDASGNPFLATTAAQLYNLSVRIWHLVLNRLPQLSDTVLGHRAMLEAIRDGRPDDARELAEGHVSEFADGVRAVL